MNRARARRRRLAWWRYEQRLAKLLGVGQYPTTGRMDKYYEDRYNYSRRNRPRVHGVRRMPLWMGDVCRLWADVELTYYETIASRIARLKDVEIILTSRGNDGRD